jgi:guanylate kinase
MGKSLLGTLYVIAAPSGGGKTSLVNAVLQADSHIEVSVSHTTRPKRPGEVDGKDYHFVTEEAFLELVNQGKFVEYATVFKHYYGTSRDWLTQKLESGTDVVLEIDWQGARQIESKLSCVSIFILPPSRKVLEERLKSRGQDSPEVIQRRMAEATQEIAHYHEFDYIVVNDHFDEALADMQAIIRARRRRLNAQRIAMADLIQELLR